MERDLPVIEDDDTWIPSLDDTSVSESPLFSPINARLKDRDDATKHHTSGAGNGNKENINSNKSELTNLSVEPQQMKRRKKGGAYNLRKSLAWDKAFSSDEGFLDPLELSMLGGSNGNSCKELLPIISEDGGKFSGNSYSKGDSSDLQVGTPKTMSNKKRSSSGSKSCCPRPLDFSSLKRPANSSILKAAVKESKLPRLPIPKLDAHALLKSSKSNLPNTSQSCQTKYNQIGQEDSKKVARSPSTSKFTKTSTSKRKSSSDAVSVSEKSLIQENKDISAGKLFSTSDLQLRQSSLATRANSSHKAPSAALPPCGSHTADSHEVVRRNRVLSEKVSVAAPMSQVQSRKPSGLRMPSPSLGYFSQPKSSGSNSFVQKVAPPIHLTGSNVTKSRKLNILNCTYDSRLPHVPVNLLKKVDNKTSNGSSEVSRSSPEFASSSDYAKTFESVNAKLAIKIVLVKEEFKVSLHAKSVEVTKENQAAQRTSDRDIEIQESENSFIDQSSLVHHMDLQKKDDHLLSVYESSDQLNEDGNNVIVDSLELKGSNSAHLENTNLVSQIRCQVFDQNVHETRDTVYHQHAKDNQSSSSTAVHVTLPESQSEGSTKDFEQDSALMTHNDDSKITLDVDQWTTKKAKSPNAFSGEDDDNITMTLPVRNEYLLFEDKESEPPKCRREDFAYGNSKLFETKRSKVLCSNVPHTSAEQANQAKSGFNQVLDEYSVADDSNGSLLFKSAAAEKCEWVHGLETRLCVLSELNHSDIIIEKQGVNQNDDVVVSYSFEQPQVDASLSNANQMIRSVQDDHCHIDYQARPGRLLETSRDQDLTELFYLRKEEIVGANDMENQLQPEVAGTEVFSNKDYLENELKLAEDRQIHQYHSGEHVRTTNHCSTDPVFSGSFQISCPSLSTMEVGKSEKDNATNDLYTGDTEMRTFNGRKSRLINSVADNIVSLVFADTSVESGQLPEMHLPSLVADHFCKENSNSPLNDCTLVNEVTSGEGREGNCLPTALTVQEQIGINQVQLSTNVEGVNEKQSLDNEPTGSTGTETLNGHDINSLDTVFKSDVVLSGQATYKESCVASLTIAAQIFGSISSNRQSYSGEKLGFFDQKIRASAEITKAVDIGVTKINSTSPADIDLNVIQNDKCLITDYQHDQDNTSCLTEDGNATVFTKRSGDCGNVDNLAIKPPVHAVPFSDEWLAAMEAAGEEILTMKRGAVQNSPTDKALPEPSPWSPVKKKQNQIGPYDCTKFINGPPCSD